MIEKLINVGIVVVILWSVGTFVIKPLGITGTLTNSGLITAIICSTVMFLAIVIPFLINGGKKNG